MSRGHGQTQVFIVAYLQLRAEPWTPLRQVALAWATHRDDVEQAAVHGLADLEAQAASGIDKSTYETVRRASKKLVESGAIESRRSLVDRRETDLRTSVSESDLRNQARAETKRAILELMHQHLTARDLGRLRRAARQHATTLVGLELLASTLSLSGDELRELVTERVSANQGVRK